MRNRQLAFYILISLWIGFFVLTYLPSLNLRYLLLDDGLSVLISKKVWSYLGSWNFGELVDTILEPDVGRVRPAYWISQALLNLVGAYKPSIVHGLRVLLLILTNIVFFKFLKKLKVNELWIWLALFIYNFDSLIFENYYRLGPVEPFLALYYVVSLYTVFFSKNNWTSHLLIIFVTFVGALTKESYFSLFLPFLCLLFADMKYSYLDKGAKQRLKYFVLSLITFGLVVLAIKASYGNMGSYASQYEVTVERIVSSTVSYIKQLAHFHSPLIYLPLGYLLYLLANYKHGLTHGNRFRLAIFFVFCLGVVTQIFVLLPWKYTLGRYLMLVNLQLAFTYAIVLQEIFNKTYKIVAARNIKSKKRTQILKLAFVVILLPIFIVRNVFPIANFQLWQKTDSEFTSELLASLATNIPIQETVYVNYIKGDANIEIFLETMWHLELFYKRGDIRLAYLDEDAACTGSDRFILDRRSDRFVSKSVLSSNQFVVEVDTGQKAYKPLNYGGVRDSFIRGYKLETWDAEYIFDWTLYKQKSGTCLDFGQGKNEV